MLVPTLDALAFLHRENWVQGQLKPANFLVVNDQLKLAVDTIRPAAVSRERVTRPTSYDAPEVERGEISVAADIWGLGVTLVEALTQYPPTWLHGRSEPPTLPTNLPAGFVDLVQRCLSINPADRPTVADLEEWIRAWASEEVEPIGAAAAEALRLVVIDDDEDEGPSHDLAEAEQAPAEPASADR